MTEYRWNEFSKFSLGWVDFKEDFGGYIQARYFVNLMWNRKKTLQIQNFLSISKFSNYS